MSEFRRKLTTWLNKADRKTSGGITRRSTRLETFGYPGGEHEPVACWEYRRAGTDLVMRFGFYSNFTENDLICKVLELNDVIHTGGGASIQFNHSRTVDRNLTLSHDGRVTVRKAISRSRLRAELLSSAPDAAEPLGIDSSFEWPIELGNVAAPADFLDRLFLYAYAIEQAKRSFRKEPALQTLKPPLPANPKESSAHADLMVDLQEVVERTNIEETTREQLISARVGQGQFREAVCRLWNDRCAVTGCSTLELLRASHIKPWRDCTDKQRLDPNNGLLLTPNWDAAFDAGLISFSDAGKALISPRLSQAELNSLGLSLGARIKLSAGNLPYLRAHRRKYGFGK